MFRKSTFSSFDGRSSCSDSSKCSTKVKVDNPEKKTRTVSPWTTLSQAQTKGGPKEKSPMVAESANIFVVACTGTRGVPFASTSAQ